MRTRNSSRLVYIPSVVFEATNWRAKKARASIWDDSSDARWCSHALIRWVSLPGLAIFITARLPGREQTCNLYASTLSLRGMCYAFQQPLLILLEQTNEFSQEDAIQKNESERCLACVALIFWWVRRTTKWFNLSCTKIGSLTSNRVKIWIMRRKRNKNKCNLKQMQNEKKKLNRFLISKPQLS